MVNLGIIISRIFPTLFSKLISIFIFLLNTFSMGEKTRARLTQERTVRLHYAQWLSLPASVRGKLILRYRKNGRDRVAKVNVKT